MICIRINITSTINNKDKCKRYLFVHQEVKRDLKYYDRLLLSMVWNVYSLLEMYISSYKGSSISEYQIPTVCNWRILCTIVTKEISVSGVTLHLCSNTIMSRVSLCKDLRENKNYIMICFINYDLFHVSTAKMFIILLSWESSISKLCSSTNESTCAMFKTIFLHKQFTCHSNIMLC